MEENRQNRGSNPYARYWGEKLSIGEEASENKGQDKDSGLKELQALSSPKTFKEPLLRCLVGKGGSEIEGVDRVIELVEPLLGHIPAKAAALYTVAMAINAYCADSELLLPELGGPKENHPELLKSLQQLTNEFKADESLMKPLADITARRLLRELFGENPPSGSEVLTQMMEAEKRDYARESNPPKPFDDGVKELERDFPWLNRDNLFNPEIFDLMGEPMIDISLSKSLCDNNTLYANHCTLLSSRGKWYHGSQYEEALVPGAGLNGLRLLPHVWRMNYEDVCAVDNIWDFPVRQAAVLINDFNPFVGEVWDSVAKRGALPQGSTDLKFIRGSLGEGEYLNQIKSPKSLVLSQVQEAGPEALAALIKHAAEKHTSSGQQDELGVHITMQQDRMETNSAIVSDLEPTLRALGFRLSSDSPFVAYRKCPTSEGRELQFTEFSFQDYNLLRSDNAVSQATRVQMGKQIWEKAGTDGFKSVWVKDASGFG